MELKGKLERLGGIFKGKERKAVMQAISDTEAGLASMKIYLGIILSEVGYKTVKDFIRVYLKSEGIAFNIRRIYEGGKNRLAEHRRKRKVSVKSSDNVRIR